MIPASALVLSLAAASLASASIQPEIPTITIDRDNVVIDRSCRVVVPEGVFIRDEDANGVVHVTASNITIEGVDRHAELIQHPKGTPYETMEGIGWRLDGVQNVTLRNIHAHRFRAGILATNCDGLTLDACDVSGGFAMRLGSTPQAEDSADWLWPHHNDDHEWRDRYGAGICVEDSSNVTIRDCFARRRQNGIILDRVRNSRVYDNDFSFLSGWGLAMWRSSDNIVSRNAFDFCIRGYSHGVYNRGQDSAGILMFEQCSRNVIAENSCTHSGDGIFAFAGRDALGESTPDADPARHANLGNNDNLFIANDLSCAAAHGLELTFSFNNRVHDNIFEGNAICGIWGGYSQNTLIANNRFERNGHAGYGLERGGINIEHGAHNTIRNNHFLNNAAGVHLWSDDDAAIRALPWARANYKGATGTLITENRFENDKVALHLRHAPQTTLLANDFRDVQEHVRAEGDAPIIQTGVLSSSPAPAYQPLGDKRPVGARNDTRGGEFIIMGKYFPWDFQEPMLRFVEHDAATHVWDLFADAALQRKVELRNADLMETSQEITANHTRIKLHTNEPGVHPYNLQITVGDHEPLIARGTIINTRWSITVFPWRTDPREDLDAWRRESQSDRARTLDRNALHLPFAHAGPTQLLALNHADIPPDRFATIARTRLELPKGRWRFSTLSDDGVRVLVDGQPVIDNWTWHAPTRDSAEILLPEARAVEILVEHFELDGYAVLELDIEPVDP